MFNYRPIITVVTVSWLAFVVATPARAVTGTSPFPGSVSLGSVAVGSTTTITGQIAANSCGSAPTPMTVTEVIVSSHSNSTSQPQPNLDFSSAAVSVTTPTQTVSGQSVPYGGNSYIRLTPAASFQQPGSAPATVTVNGVKVIRPGKGLVTVLLNQAANHCFIAHGYFDFTSGGSGSTTTSTTPATSRLATPKPSPSPSPSPSLTASPTASPSVQASAAVTPDVPAKPAALGLFARLSLFLQTLFSPLTRWLNS